MIKYYKIYAFLCTSVLLLPLIIWGYLVYLFSPCIRPHTQHILFYKGIKGTASLLLFLLGIRIRECKPSSLPRPPRPVIYIANHTSYLDSLLILLVTNAHTYPLGKTEIARFPIIGFLYERYVIPLDRERLSSKKKSYVQMDQLLREGKNLFIFPEGGFKDEPNARLMPFNMGAFRLAATHQVPIYPLVFLHAKDRLQRIHRKVRVRAGLIEIQHLSPIYPPASLETSDIENLKTTAFQAIHEVLSAYVYPV